MIYAMLRKLVMQSLLHCLGTSTLSTHVVWIFMTQRQKPSDLCVRAFIRLAAERIPIFALRLEDSSWGRDEQGKKPTS